MEVKTWFDEKLPQMLEKDPDKAKEVDGVIVFKITGDGGGTWTADLKSEPPSVKPEEVGEPDATMEITADDFKQVLDDFNLAMQFYFQGTLKWEGDPMLATKLNALFVEE
jgi:hypothetical protein